MQGALQVQVQVQVQVGAAWGTTRCAAAHYTLLHYYCAAAAASATTTTTAARLDEVLDLGEGERLALLELRLQVGCHGAGGVREGGFYSAPLRTAECSVAAAPGAAAREGAGVEEGGGAARGRRGAQRRGECRAGRERGSGGGGEQLRAGVGRLRPLQHPEHHGQHRGLGLLLRAEDGRVEESRLHGQRRVGTQGGQARPRKQGRPPHRGGAAVRRCGGAAVRRCGGAAVRRCGGAAVRRCGGAARAVFCRAACVSSSAVGAALLSS